MTRNILQLILILTLSSVAGCASMLGGHDDSRIASEEALAELGPEAAEEARQIYTELAADLENFGVMKDGIYRSAAPDPEQMRVLKDLGFVTIVDFRDEEDRTAAEQEAASLAGLRYRNLPWSGGEEIVPKEHVAELFRILDDPGNLPALVHCKRGAERTGTMMALYRIEFDDWTPEQAYAEMNRYRFRSFWYGNLKRIVFDYEKGSIMP